ncbi:MAG: cytochrome c oxidase subunit 3 family protein [Deltaproteobacteria bacterium]|nr:cytochrome c oxidase subunit 3 family protein [Deltaproteobacteria bacterium]
MASGTGSQHSVAEAGSPPVYHHIDPINAYHASKLGMWLFLATEILLFSVLFASFALYNWMYFEDFHHAASKLDWRLGGLNTAILLFSSYTAAVAVYKAQISDNKGVVVNFSISFLCGLVFLVIKYFEYSAKYAHGYFPGTDLWSSPDFSEHYKNYFGLYYVMTGLHALHVVIGMAVLSWVILLATKRRFSERYYTPVELAALYWHLVDLIWIFLFPILYLID